MEINKHIKKVEPVKVYTKKLSNGETMEYMNIPTLKQLNIVPAHLKKIKRLNFVGSNGAIIKVRHLEDGLMAAKLAYQKYKSTSNELFEYDHGNLFETLEVANDELELDFIIDDSLDDEEDWSDWEEEEDEDEDFEPTEFGLVHQEVSDIIYKNEHIVSLPIVQLSKFTQKVFEPHYFNNPWQMDTFKSTSYWVDKSFPLIIIDDNPVYNGDELLKVLKKFQRFIILISVDPEKKPFLSAPTELDHALAFDCSYEYWDTELPSLQYYESALVESVHSANFKLSPNINKSDLITLFKEYRGIHFTGLEDIYKWVSRVILKKTNDSNTLNYIDFERVLNLF